ncbi:DUF5590 domain-containing protein [Alteribacter aurantiacus]|uniref:cell wall elongation regulator TseB-like domain-containing protein n=1 Tax=Alteribacter aurantiacus TaxID=254410 RepID=UPI00042914F0|nr:DUF5590 domain-containing protein [Alteribacter aurantiacus]
MKRWTIFTGITLFIITFSSLIWLFSSVQSNKNETFEGSIEYALSNDLITEYSNVSYYNGRRSYHIIDGVDQEGDDVYVWIESIQDEQESYSSVFEESDEEENVEDEVSEPRTYIRKQEDGISASQARQIAEQHLGIDEFKQVRLGMIGQTPVYEIVYIDTEDRYSFYYISFEEGDYIRHYQLRRST